MAYIIGAFIFHIYEKRDYYEPFDVERGADAAVGDLFVECVVETPVNLTDRQRDLLRQFESADAPGAHPESEGFMARVKEFIDDLRR